MENSQNKPNSTHMSKTFSTKNCSCGKTVAFLLCSMDKRVYIDVWILKITIKTNQIDIDVCFFQKYITYKKHRDSGNEWRGSYEIKMNNLEFSRLLTNLKIESEIYISFQQLQSLFNLFLFHTSFGIFMVAMLC